MQPFQQGDKAKSSRTLRGNKSEMSLPSLCRASNTSAQDGKSLRLVDVVAIRRCRTPAIGKGAIDCVRYSAGGGSRGQENRLEAHDFGWYCRTSCKIRVSLELLWKYNFIKESKA